ncbi:MAG: site-2 protease family protein [Chloroflexi bacterium]|nr:site-2 protease family protein [Chloroflexota bacterium]
MPIDSLVQGRLTQQAQNAVIGYFDVESIRFDVSLDRYEHAIRLSGRFLTSTEEAYDAIARRASRDGFITFFRSEGKEQVIYLVQGEMPAHRPRWRLAVALFVFTAISVFVTGGLMQSNAEGFSIDWKAGFSYAGPLLLILLAHELGHFFVGRRYRMAVSPPYFIPLPLSILGTLGAVIVMRAPPKNRKHLLQLGAAGPLAGLVFAIPLLIYGLLTSEVAPLPTDQTYLMEGNSIFYLAVKYLIFGQMLPSADGMDVFLNNIAFAAWAGLLVTALNLIPVGQLDGGHAAYTLFGQRIRPLTYVIIAALVVLAWRTQFWGWLLWAGLLFFFGQVHATPFDDLTPLDGKHKLLALFMLALFILLFAPNPLRIVQP